VIRDYFKRRRLRKRAEALLSTARLAQHMREDIAPPADLERMAIAMQSVQEAARRGEETAFRRAEAVLERAIDKVYPKRPFAAAREWLELAVVALSVAMGFRTYFLQPFKIPTGSMQPTLYGVHYRPDGWPSDFREWVPLKVVRWAITGERPMEIRARTAGQAIFDPRVHPRAPIHILHVGPSYYEIPKGLKLHVRNREWVVEGQLLASGVTVSGDHIFVNRLIWNFRRPTLGEVMVFHTHGMDPAEIIPNTHYIKRLAGRPGDELRIEPPVLYVNGKDGREIPAFRKVIEGVPGYEAGYQNGRTLGNEVRYLTTDDETYRVPEHHYFGLGDNSINSKDSRYFGPIHESRLLGPAVWVYWPISERWGWIR